MLNSSSALNPFLVKYPLFLYFFIIYITRKSSIQEKGFHLGKLEKLLLSRRNSTFSPE